MSVCNKRGFTLVELLVVIAIIGLLASVILASLNSARVKSRDARRIADLKQLQNALELYANDNGGTYPDSASEADVSSVLSALVPNYISVLPNDPLPGAQPYRYKSDAASVSSMYCLGAKTEGGAPTPTTTCQSTLLLSNVVTWSIGN